MNLLNNELSMLKQRFLGDVRSYDLQLFKHVVVMEGWKAVVVMVIFQNFQNNRHDPCFARQIFVNVFVSEMSLILLVYCL